jgi:hypothetical protein
VWRKHRSSDSDCQPRTLPSCIRRASPGVTLLNTFSGFLARPRALPAATPPTANFLGRPSLVIRPLKPEGLTLDVTH